jgi:hypothetical protein
VDNVSHPAVKPSSDSSKVNALDATEGPSQAIEIKTVLHDR